MTPEQKTILLVIEQYLTANPGMRFGQALFNLGVNRFADEYKPESKDFFLRDIYNDSDATVLERMSS